MKLISLKCAAMIGGCLFMLACSNNNGESAATEGVDAKADSLAAEEAKMEELYQDSLMNVEIDAQYEEALSINTGKVKVTWPDESSVPVSTVPYTVENNTDVPLTADDYKITYSYVVEDTVDGYLEDVKKKGKSAGVDVDAKATAEGTLKVNGNNVKNVNVELTISKEDFAARFKELKTK